MSSGLSHALAFLFATSTENPCMGSNVAEHCYHRRQGRRRHCCRRLQPLSLSVWVRRGFEGFGGEGEGRRRRQRRGSGVGSLGSEKMKPSPFCVISIFLFFSSIYVGTISVLLTQIKLQLLSKETLEFCCQFIIPINQQKDIKIMTYRFRNSLKMPLMSQLNRILRILMIYATYFENWISKINITIPQFSSRYRPEFLTRSLKIRVLHSFY